MKSTTKYEQVLKGANKHAKERIFIVCSSVEVTYIKEDTKIEVATSANDYQQTKLKATSRSVEHEIRWS